MADEPGEDAVLTPVADGVAPPTEARSNLWGPAWSLGDGSSLVEGTELSTVLTGKGLATPGSTSPCENGTRVVMTEGTAVLGVRVAAGKEFPKPAAVTAVTMEAVAWRVAEAAGPYPGILPGGAEDRDPATFQGIRVHSARKTQRKGAPVYVAIGERREQLVVAIIDKEARQVLASDVQTRSAGWGEPSAVAATDLDGDEIPEVVVHGQDAAGGQYRLVYTTDLTGTPSLKLRDRFEVATAKCGRS